jgi:hypothetical protein
VLFFEDGFFLPDNKPILKNLRGYVLLLLLAAPHTGSVD